MENKAKHSLELIKLALSKSKNPAVLWSGGKDSTVLLWLARLINPSIECIQWTLPWMKSKWSFHNKLADLWNLTVHDALPKSVALCHGNSRIDFIEAYAIGSDNALIARGTEPPEEGRPFVCGVEWLQRPKAAEVQFPWDVLLCGHKTGDSDPCSGPVPLQVDVLRNPGCAETWYPLKDWTDQDISSYTLDHGIPWDENRYELVDGSLVTKSDKHGNSDYYHTCTACINKQNPGFVPCPKLNGLMVKNLSEFAQHHEPVMPYCGLRTE